MILIGVLVLGFQHQNFQTSEPTNMSLNPDYFPMEEWVFSPWKHMYYLRTSHWPLEMHFSSIWWIFNVIHLVTVWLIFHKWKAGGFQIYLKINNLCTVFKVNRFCVSELEKTCVKAIYYTLWALLYCSRWEFEYGHDKIYTPLYTVFLYDHTVNLNLKWTCTVCFVKFSNF